MKDGQEPEWFAQVWSMPKGEFASLRERYYKLLGKSSTNGRNFKDL